MTINIAPRTGTLNDGTRFDVTNSRTGDAAMMEHVAKGQAVLVQGHGGQSVAELQQKLAQAGYLTTKPDGQFGPATRDALKKFQKANGLPEDGKFGKETYAKLFADGAARAGGSKDEGKTPPALNRQDAERRTEFVDNQRRRADIVGQMKTAPAWSKETFNDEARREQVATAGLARLDKLEKSLDGMEPRKRARVEATIRELREKYQDLKSGDYLRDEGPQRDANAAMGLEDKLIGELGGTR